MIKLPKEFMVEKIYITNASSKSPTNEWKIIKIIDL